MRGQPDFAVGNVVGSNLFNILLIIGGTVAYHRLPASVGMQQMELPLMLMFMVTGYIAMGRKQLITRGEGVLLLSAFITYLAGDGLNHAHHIAGKASKREIGVRPTFPVAKFQSESDPYFPASATAAELEMQGRIYSPD